ncbi:MAG: hypothetical protein ISR64_00560 [Deltaproteobacteria bacterium]|nr:hypothetical protein [Deltaproteobacteria bacterium]
MKRMAYLWPFLVLFPAQCADVNHPPDVAPVGDLTVTVGEALSIALVATDPDGDSVTFEVQGAPAGARVTADGQGGWRFEYSPLASHAGPSGTTYELVFTALDHRGGETREATDLHVLPEGSVPEFKGPFAWTLNLAENDHLTAFIQVKDADTASLVIELIKGFEGALFDQVDGHTASIYWKPRPHQVGGSPVYTFTVSADDGSHAKVFADFAVVLVNSEMFGGCPGTPPTATHQPLSDQHGGGSYSVSVETDDLESQVREVTCFWSAVKGTPEPEMNRLELPGSIPNLAAAADSGRLVYYHFLATDDDDQTSDYCDHAVRLPKTGEFAFAAYGPDHPDTCLGDLYGDPQTVPAQLPEGTVTGLRLCHGTEDVFTRLLVHGEGLAVAATPMSASGPLTVILEDPQGAILVQAPFGAFTTALVDGEFRVRVRPDDGKAVTYSLAATTSADPCQDDTFEPNQTPTTASLITQGLHQATLCPANPDYYGFHLDAGKAAAVTLTFDPQEADLDLTLFETDWSVPIRVSASTLGTEELVAEAAVPTDFLVRVDAVGLDSSAYGLDLQVEGQETLCEDDLFSPNASPYQAPVVFEATYPKLKLCPTKTDYFETGLNGGETLSVWVEVPAGQVAPPLAILAGDGQTVLAQGNTTGQMSQAEVVVPGPGPILIRTGPVTGQAVNYSLGFAASDPPGPCGPDRFEPNDQVETAPSLPQGLTTHLTLCPGDVDIFATKMGAWQTIAAYVLNGSVAVSTSILDAEEALVAAGTPAQYGEELFFLTQETGTFYLQVRASTGGQGWYDVFLQTE